VLHSGSHGATVLGLQYVLRDQGATYPTGTGTFAGNMEKAGKHFQQVNHLSITGVVDDATWSKIIVNESRYDGSLLSEVRTFQRRVGVKDNGIFGMPTTEKMVTVIAIAGHEACNIQPLGIFSTNSVGRASQRTNHSQLSRGEFVMNKLGHLLAAGAVVTGGGAAITSGAVMSSASPAMACSVGQQSSPEIRYADSLPKLKYGSHGSAVLGLQMYLRGQGLTYLNGTGNYGANTIKAVKHFQARHNLPVTGIVTKTTWRHIITSQFHLPVPNYPNPQLSPGQSLDGPHGSDLKNMTMRLSSLSWFDWNDSHKVYHGALLASVKEYQRRVGINPSGVFGARTTESMNTVIAIAGDWGC
jgi:peptidoglycan hydrolase-like protein with peptidoglycan-binding domain